MHGGLGDDFNTTRTVFIIPSHPLLSYTVKSAEDMLLGAGRIPCFYGPTRFRFLCFRPKPRQSCYHSKPLLKPQRPLKRSKAQPPTPPALGSDGWKKSHFLRPLSALASRWRTIVVLWAGLTACVYIYVAFDSLLVRENVPVSGRSRYAGSKRPNAFYAEQLQKGAALERAVHSHAAACGRCKPKLEEDFLPGDDPLVTRVRGVFARLATAAGIQPESFIIRVNKQPGMTMVVVLQTPPAQRLC